MRELAAFVSYIGHSLFQEVAEVFNVEMCIFVTELGQPQSSLKKNKRDGHY